MKKLLLPLLAALALPTAVNAEITNDYILKFNQAQELITKGKFSEGEKICDELIKTAPEIQYAYVCKGIALGFANENKKQRKALRNFTKAIKIDPEYTEAYYFRGLLQFQMRRRKDFGIARTACNDMSKAYFNNYSPALDYVQKNKSFVKGECYQFIRE